jgi:hypothetical protein
MARVRKALTATALGAAAFALIAAAAGTTGAYFSDSQGGSVNGTLGQVKLTTSNTTFAWTNMLPGEPQTATVGFQNIGTGPQDFYLVFQNGPALHALNNLGKYGEVHVTGGKTGNINALFDSANLQDGRTRADLSNSCSSIFVQANLGCWPLPAKLKVASSVAAQGTGSLSFTFNYAGILGNSSNIGGPFNKYPSNYGAGHEAFGDDILGAQGEGLPFTVVAVQVGQQP